MVFPGKHVKTLEFPYGSMSGSVDSGPVKTIKTGPDPSLNQPNSDGTGRVLKRVESGHFRVDGVCHRKGSSHSGFLSIFFTFLGNRPFCHFQLDPVIQGSGSSWIRGHQGPDPVKRVHNAVHLRPLDPGWPGSRGTWVYPTLTLDGPGLALATGLE